MEEKYGDLGSLLEKHLDNVRKTIDANKDLADANKNLENSQQGINSLLKEGIAIAPTVADSVVQVTQSIASLASAAIAAKGIVDTLKNPELSG